ncbi:MAG: RelA/SpoT family protein [Bacteroidia bacterium]|jgi:GTP pyrophosphokinase|nr:RelA/SpoT family protein [Bacteroidia bacterium]
MQQVIDTEKENKEIVKAYRNVIKACKRNLDNNDRKQIRKAFEMAVDAHKNMRRKSGEPYILHPLAVAQICAEEIGLGATSIICALLHDVVEDTSITLDVIELNFGNKVSRIIDGLTKISGVFEQQDKSIQAENFKKLLLTLSDDVRVILIKLADRLHNMRTLDSMSAKSQLKIASETHYVYAPLAHRLGLYAIKTELEDLATKYLEPDKYNFVKNKLQETKAQRNRYIKQFIEPLIDDLNKDGLKYEIKGRPKSIHSILNKMKKQNIPFEEVYDLFAIRIIINAAYEDEKSDCWHVYSVVTNHYRPNPDRLRDWISTPKANGYESLHTTVMGPKGKWVEVQIRTLRMDEIAEKGYAAHWKYKDANTKQDIGLEEWLARVREILENPEQNALDFLDDFKMNFFADEIFLFTPKGELRKLPANSTVLDFAFDVHTQLGERCIGGKVNNKLVPLNHVLLNGDQVEILTSTKQTPKEEWLNYVVTAKAKSKIRDWYKQVKLRASAMGKEILERKFAHEKIPFTSEHLQELIFYFKLPSVTELYAQVAQEKLDKTRLHIAEILEEVKQQRLDHQLEIKQLKEAKALQKNTTGNLPKEGVIVGDDTDLPYSFSKCCNPIPGDDIFGFITVGEGVKIHRTNCSNAISLMSNYGYRVIKARWANEVFAKTQAFHTRIKVEGIDSVGIVSIITDIISKQLQINMNAIQIASKSGMFEGAIDLEVHDTNQLEELMNKIKASSPLIKVSREDII